jgi:hypothetical protein
MIRALFLISSLAITAHGFSQSFISNGVSYEVISGSNNTVDAVDYNTAFGTQVSIPKVVTDPNTNSKYNVVGIEDEAFMSKGLTSLTLSEGLQTIGLKAFWDNNITGHLTIPNSVTYIGANSFISNSISSLDLGTGVQVVYTQAFAANLLTSIVIPGSITTLGAATFGDNQISNVTIEAGAGNLGVRTFWGNPLTSITCEGTTPSIITTGGNEDTFKTTTGSTDRQGMDLIIPYGTTAEYVTDPGALWTGFNSVTESTPVGLQNFELENDIHLYNTQSSLTINSESSTPFISYDIYSMSGPIKHGSDENIDISSIPNGIYIISMQFEAGTVIKRFIK